MNCRFCKQPVRPLSRLLSHIEEFHPKDYEKVRGELKQINETASAKEDFLRSTEKLNGV